METLTKTFKLPSAGYFGGTTEVTLRPMTTKEEKLIYTARDMSFIERLVKSCIVEPENISMDQLHSADITYLLYMLRELTFGPTYMQTTICPNCGKRQEVEIDITKMTYKILDLDEFEKIKNIKLPLCEDTITIKLISQKEIDEIADYIKKQSSKLQDAEGYEYIYRFAKLVEKINDEEKDIKEVVNYLENLNLRDFNEIKKTLSKVEIGINTSNNITCRNCLEEMEVEGLTVPEFFRSF